MKRLLTADATAQARSDAPRCAFCPAPATCREAYGRLRRFCCDAHKPLESEPLEPTP